MKPNDIIEVKMKTGVSLWWEIEGVFIGGLNQESVTKLKPIGQIPNTEGDVLVPHQLLDVAVESSPNIKHYREVHQ